MRSLVLVFLFFSGVLAITETSKTLDPAELTKPLIVDPNALTEEQQQNVASVAQVLANEPPSASEAPPAADEDALAGLLDAGGAGTGSTDSSNAPASASESDSGDSSSDEGGDSSSDPKAESAAIEKEIKLLSSLIEHGKAIAAALPEKEQRLKELSAKLDAAGASQKAAGAKQQLAEQKLLLAQIELKIGALKQKLEDLETTQTKLQASIAKVESAVDSSAAVEHDLNQKAAVASVGDATGAAASTDAAGAPAAAAPAASFLDQSIANAAKVTKQAKAALRSFSKPFQNLLR
jgi:hypothetical protein